MDYIEEISGTYISMLGEGYQIKKIHDLLYVVDPFRQWWDTPTIEKRLMDNPEYGGAISFRNDAKAAKRALNFLNLYKLITKENRRNGNGRL